MMYVHKLVTDTGFFEEYWRRLAEMRALDPDTTQEAAYEAVNGDYRKVFGQDRFKSFEAFRKARDRRKTE